MKLTEQQKQSLLLKKIDLNELVSAFNEDINVYMGRGHKTAGVRVRKRLLEIKKLAHELRLKVSDMNKDSEE